MYSISVRPYILYVIFFSERHLSEIHELDRIFKCTYFPRRYFHNYRPPFREPEEFSVSTPGWGRDCGGRAGRRRRGPRSCRGAPGLVPTHPSLFYQPADDSYKHKCTVLWNKPAQVAAMEGFTQQLLVKI